MRNRERREKMTKIIVLSNMYPSSNHPTFGIFVKNQVGLLNEVGVDTKVVAIQDPGKGKLTKLFKYSSWFIRAMFQTWKNRKTIDLVHAHYIFPTGVVAYLGKKWFGVPYVVTAHGGDIDQMPKKSPRIAAWTKKILQHADQVIAVGEKLKEDVVHDFEVEESKVHVVSMGVDPEVFHVRPQEIARETLQLSKEATILLYVGNVIRAKGIIELIEAYELARKENEQLLLYIVGSQKDTSFVQEVQALIQEKQLEEGIHLVGPQPQKTLARWMAAADVFVLPSYHEGFGLVALEAMAVGTPVVGSNVGGLPYLLANDAGILVEPQNSQSLAKGIEQALSRPEERYTEAKSEIVKKHSYETIAQELLAIYEATKRQL